MKKTLLPLLWVWVLVTATSIYAANAYSSELQDAYSWAYSKHITTMPTIERANMDWNITRAEMAKMIANYAEEVLWKKVDTSKDCNFSDVDTALDEKYDNWITKSCQLWLMWQWITRFRPNDTVSRAEFWTILSRALWWDKNDGWETFYENHLKALKDEWIMNNISNPDSKEVRWYVMLMMQRSNWEWWKNAWNNQQFEMKQGSWNQMWMPWDMNGNQPPKKPEWDMPGSGWMWKPPMMQWSWNQMWMPGDWQTPPAKPDGEWWKWMPWNMMGWNQSNTNISYNWANTISSSTTLSNKSYSSSTANQNSLLIDWWDSTLTSITVSKSWDSDWWDSADFYWTNAAILAKGGKLTIKDSTINTDATHANAVYAYWEGSIIISDSTITTKKNTSWGIMVTWGGTLVANNVTASTEGNSSAPIRSDRWGWTLTVNGWKYTSNWVWSPAIYSTADITVNDAELVSNVSEWVVVEGKNSVKLNNTTVTANNTKLNGQSSTYKTIFLYQSVSWDADEGTAEFDAKDSKIISKNWDTFFVTNTSAKISLENTTITNSVWDFLRIQSWAWWKSGQNGWDVILSLKNQKAEWDIIVDSISSLKMSMSNSSNYIWAINTENQSNNVTVSLDKSSTWTLTADSYITSLDNEVSDNSNINLNGYKLIIANS